MEVKSSPAQAHVGWTLFVVILKLATMAFSYTSAPSIKRLAGDTFTTPVTAIVVICCIAKTMAFFKFCLSDWEKVATDSPRILIFKSAGKMVFKHFLERSPELPTSISTFTLEPMFSIEE
jgi:hypothetical protein